jgi:Effector Associated Constant Component 1
VRLLRARPLWRLAVNGEGCALIRGEQRAGGRLVALLAQRWLGRASWLLDQGPRPLAAPLGGNRVRKRGISCKMMLRRPQKASSDLDCASSRSLSRVDDDLQQASRTARPGWDMTVDESGCIELTVSDYAQIGSLQEWLCQTPNVQIQRIVGHPGAGQQGALDVLAVLAGSSSLVAALKVIPDFLRSRRSGLSITTTVKGKQFILDATNIDEVMPILERLLDD